MDLEQASSCRLCALHDINLNQVDKECAEHIFFLFRLQIGGSNDKLSIHICETCRETVKATWLFYEQIKRSQQELLEQTIPSLIARDERLIDCVINDSDLSVDPLLEQIDIKESLMIREPKEEDKFDDEKKLSVITEIIPDLSEADCEFNEDGSIKILKNVETWENYPWVCCVCQQNVSGSDELNDHFINYHQVTTRYACADCPKIYSNINVFVTHVRTHRFDLRFCCDICNKWFVTQKNVERHRILHNDKRPHVCEICGKSFRLHSALVVHSRSHLPDDVKNRYNCDQCSKKFSSRPNLIAHKRIHAGVRNHTCDQCGKSFVQKGNLENHMLTHTVARPFSCSTCGKSFKTMVRLNKHSTVHSEHKPHQCDVCGRQFREKGTLKEHHRIHTGAMPFTCEFCGKNFRFKGVLTTHRRQHTGERPYSCLECQHHFTNWPNYNKHMKRRHGINTSVTVRKPQTIPPTGMPQRNPPGSVLAPPQLPDTPINNEAHSFYPALNLYNLSEEILQHRNLQ